MLSESQHIHSESLSIVDRLLLLLLLLRPMLFVIQTTGPVEEQPEPSEGAARLPAGEHTACCNGHSLVLFLPMKQQIAEFGATTRFLNVRRNKKMVWSLLLSMTREVWLLAPMFEH